MTSTTTCVNTKDSLICVSRSDISADFHSLFPTVYVNLYCCTFPSPSPSPIISKPAVNIFGDTSLPVLLIIFSGSSPRSVLKLWVKGHEDFKVGQIAFQMVFFHNSASM